MIIRDPNLIRDIVHYANRLDNQHVLCLRANNSILTMDAQYAPQYKNMHVVMQWYLEETSERVQGELYVPISPHSCECLPETLEGQFHSIKDTDENDQDDQPKQYVQTIMDVTSEYQLCSIVEDDMFVLQKTYARLEKMDPPKSLADIHKAYTVFALRYILAHPKWSQHPALKIWTDMFDIHDDDLISNPQLKKIFMDPSVKTTLVHVLQSIIDPHTYIQAIELTNDDIML